MDVQLKELIDRIKSEGIKSAEEQAGAIIEEAEKKAKQIVADAEKEADSIRQKAEADVRKMEYTGRESLKQAGRDLIISLQQRLQVLFDEVVYTDTAGQLKGDSLQKVIAQLVEHWNEDVQNLELLVAEDELKKLEKGLRDKLSAQLAKGMEIKPLANVDAGFKVSYKDGSAYYNFSAEGVAEIISEFLNPKLAEILKEAVKEQE
ncbi:MAG: V-type ATP synthase subunit E [Spirochaetota bacterium]|nr:V-type ATP synthase subunit E [Spirochaetota bacterium]